MRWSRKTHPGQQVMNFGQLPRARPPAGQKTTKEKHTFSEQMLTAILREVRNINKTLQGGAA